MLSDMETDEFEQVDCESPDDKSDHGESHNWAGIIVILCLQINVHMVTHVLCPCWFVSMDNSIDK